MNTQSATNRGMNPFAPGRIGSAMSSPQNDTGAHSYDARAKGVDGDLLDAMLKGRWEEGHGTGYEDGHAAARQRYQSIYDDGFSAGLGTGADEAAGELASRLLPVLQRALASFAEIASRTSSQKIRDRANLHVVEIGDLLDREGGQHTDGSEKVNIGAGIPTGPTRGA